MIGAVDRAARDRLAQWVRRMPSARPTAADLDLVGQSRPRARHLVHLFDQLAAAPVAELSPLRLAALRDQATYPGPPLPWRRDRPAPHTIEETS